MTKIDTLTREQMHRGSFADGQTSPDRYPDDLEASCRGRGDRRRYPDDDRAGASREARRDRPRTPSIDRSGRAEEDGRFIG